jgi:hypothetical protein
MVPKEATSTTVNLTFQISPGSKCDAYDMHNAYLKMRVNRFLTYTCNGAIICSTIVFIEDKHAAHFFRQVRIYYNDLLIMESLDFVYETNILGATFTNHIKYKYPKTFSASTGVEVSGPNIAIELDISNSNVCGT